MPSENQTRSPSANTTRNTSPNQAPEGPQHNNSNNPEYATSTRDGNRNNTDVMSLGPRLSPHRIWEMDSRRSESSGHSNYISPIANISSLPSLRESSNDNVLSTTQKSIGVSDISKGPRVTRRVTPTPLTIPSTPILSARSLPGVPSSRSSGYPSSGNLTSATYPPAQTYRPRTRRVVTKETSPDDSNSVTELGMAPFMPGQDAMSNQNRLVRNESIMAQHFLRLKHGTTRTNEERAKTEQNIYQMLAEHKAQINNLSTSTSSARHTASVRDDPEFVALLNAQAEMRNTLEALVAQVAESSGSARSRQLIASPSRSNTSTSTPGLSPLLFPSTMHSQPSAMEPENSRSLKRKYYELPSPESLFRPSPHTPRPAWAPALAPTDYRSTDVIYGPVSREVDGGGGSSAADNFLHPDPNMHAIADEAVRDVGMHARVIRSVRRAHDGTFISIRFVKHEFAAKFVELVASGHDGHVERSATLVDADSQNTMGAPTSSRSKLW